MMVPDPYCLFIHTKSVLSVYIYFAIKNIIAFCFLLYSYFFTRYHKPMSVNV